MGGTATGVVNGTVEGIFSAIVGSNYNDTLSAGGVPYVALTGGLGVNTLSGFEYGDAAVESIASTYTLTNSSLTGSGLGGSFSDTLNGIQDADLTGSTGSANIFNVSGWTGSGSLTGHAAVTAVTASKDSRVTLTNTVLTAGDGMVLSLSGIKIADLTASTSAGTAAVVIYASAFSGVTNLAAYGTGNAILFSGSGSHNNLRAAGSGNDILIGNGALGTLIDSGSGSNIFIGAGAGRDSLIGGGNDILVSGTTEYDGDTIASIKALDHILAVWDSGLSYAKRISAIEEGIGRNHADSFNFRTIKTDNNANTLSDRANLFGSHNWFLVSTHDTVTRRPNEIKTII